MHTICVRANNTAYIIGRLPGKKRKKGDVVIIKLLTQEKKAALRDNKHLLLLKRAGATFCKWKSHKLQHLHLARDQTARHLTVTLPPSESLL